MDLYPHPTIFGLSPYQSLVLHLRTYIGKELTEHIPALAHLRRQIFREFPYLYEGSEAYEMEYLNTYMKAPRSFSALCLDGEKIIGATTAVPLLEADVAFRRPLEAAGYAPEKILYYGESVLLPEYRGQGVGKKFMQAREHYAHSLPGISQIAFCAVIRSPTDPRRPEGYRPLDTFWKSWGFALLPGITATYSWHEIGIASEVENKLQFWLKTLA